MRTLSRWCSLLLLLPVAFGAQLSFPGTLTVLGTDYLNGVTGPTFVVNGNYVGTDTITLTADGTVDLANGSFTANAAGVVISPNPTNTGATPGQVTLSGGIPYAALLLGNGSLGFFPVFPANAANGLGSLTPPTTLTLINAPLSSIFGAGVNIANGTVLQFRINDINSLDNSGAFRVSAVPEPSSMLLMGAGLLSVVAFRRKLKR